MTQALASAFSPTAIAWAAIAFNFVLYLTGRRLSAAHTIMQCCAMVVLTALLLYVGVSPMGQIPAFGSAQANFSWKAIQAAWWILCAGTVVNVTRSFSALGGPIQRQRFLLDVVKAVCFLSAGLAIITDVLNIPIRGVLATSGVVAIVLGLALQSTLADFFSGLVINTSDAYVVGDTISVDGKSQGTVVEITWRATHLLTDNRDLLVLPNSMIAKSAITNHSSPSGAHAVVSHFETPPNVRPAHAARALKLALETCVGVADFPAPSVVVSRRTWEATHYEITYFLTPSAVYADAVTAFYDAAHRHLATYDVLMGQTRPDEAGEVESLPYRLVLGVDVFGSLSMAERSRLSSVMVRREYLPGDIVSTAGTTPQAVSVIADGIVTASITRGSEDAEVMRFGPGDYFGESGAVAGVASMAKMSARTHCVIYDIPAKAIKSLFAEHPEIIHALAVRLAMRMRAGNAFAAAEPGTPQREDSGLLSWITQRIHLFHKP